MGARSATEGQLGGCFGLRGRLWAWPHNCICLSELIKLCKVKSEFYHVEVMPYTYSVIQSVKCADSFPYHVCFCFLCVRDSQQSPAGEKQKCNCNLQVQLVSLGPGSDGDGRGVVCL